MNPTFLMEKPHIFMWCITVINKTSFTWLVFSVNNILLNLEIDLTNLKFANIIYPNNSKHKFILLFPKWISL